MFVSFRFLGAGLATCSSPFWVSVHERPSISQISIAKKSIIYLSALFYRFTWTFYGTHWSWPKRSTQHRPENFLFYFFRNTRFLTFDVFHSIISSGSITPQEPHRVETPRSSGIVFVNFLQLEVESFQYIAHRLRSDERQKFDFQFLEPVAPFLAHYHSYGLHRRTYPALFLNFILEIIL